MIMKTVEAERKTKLASKLRILAEQHKLSQKEIADRHNLSISTIYRIFGGKTEPSALDLMSILEEFKISVEQMIDDRLQSTLDYTQWQNHEKTARLIKAIGTLMLSLDTELQKHLLGIILRSAIDSTKPNVKAKLEIQNYLGNMNLQNH